MPQLLSCPRGTRLRQKRYNNTKTIKGGRTKWGELKKSHQAGDNICEWEKMTHVYAGGAKARGVGTSEVGNRAQREQRECPWGKKTSWGEPRRERGARRRMGARRGARDMTARKRDDRESGR